VGLGQALREVVRRVLPEAAERAYPVWKAIGYVHPEAGYLCGIFPYPDRVALAFEYGVLLDDPQELLRAGRTSARKVRYLEVRTRKDVRSRAIESWLRQSIAMRTGGRSRTLRKERRRQKRGAGREGRSADS
jgi:hypothetical protein